MLQLAADIHEGELDDITHGISFELVDCGEMSLDLFIQRGISFNRFQFSSMLECTNTEKHTHTHAR